MERISICDGFVVQFDTSDPIIREIYKELSNHSISGSTDPDLTFRGREIDFSQDSGNHTEFDSISDTIVYRNKPSLSRHSLRDTIRRYIGLLGWTVEITSDNSALDVTISYDERIKTDSTPLEWLIRFVNRSYIWRYQNLAKVILYNVIEPICHAKLVQCGYGFIHASAVARDDGVILFTGGGGAGKTSTMESILTNENMAFVSDDLCLISSSGRAYPYLKRVQLYPYNISSASGSIADLDEIGSRLQWKIRKLWAGSDGVRRRIPPDKRYENIIENSSRDIDAIVFIQRTDSDTINVKRITSGELMRRSTAVIIEEFREMWWRMLQSSALGASQLDFVEFTSSTQDVYKSAFDSSDNYLVTVPHDADPDSIRAEIISSVDIL